MSSSSDSHGTYEFMEEIGREMAPAASDARFQIGDQVIKHTGYPFPGEVRAVFTTRAGKVRYVVEATGSDYAGMVHIFNGDQLHYADIREGFDV